MDLVFTNVVWNGNDQCDCGFSAGLGFSAPANWIFSICKIAPYGKVKGVFTVRISAGHQLQVICSSISSLREYIRKKQAEIDSLRIHLQPRGEFNHRQLALLKHALKHPFTGYTVVSHQTSHGVSYQTAKNDLESLVGKTLLTRGKQGKAFIYSPARNLATLLEK